MNWRLFRPGAGGAEHGRSALFVALFTLCVAASHWCLLQFGTIFFWPANGVLVAALLLLHRPAALRVLVVCAFINLLGNTLRESPLHMVAIGTMLNLAESLAAAAIARRFCGARLDLRRPRRLAAFVLLAVAPSCAGAALIGITALGVPLHEFAVGCQTWFAADALGLIIITPLLLLAAQHRGESSARQRLEVAALLLLLTGTTLAIFLQTRAPLEFLVFLPELLIAFRLSPIWSALAILIVAMIGTVATLSGYGPMTLGMLGPAEWENERILRALQTLPTFQLFMVALIAVALPATTVLTERRRLTARLKLRTAAAEAAQRRIAHMAAHDAESDLPNRIGLMQSLQRAQAPLFVAALSIDRFARIRSAIGSGEAARLLARTARLLAERLPDGRAALLSSDTIGLQLPAADPATAEQRLRHALAGIDGPLSIGEAQVDVTLTAGLAPVEEPGRGIDCALLALDQAKATSRPLTWFDAEAERVAAGGLAMLSAIRAGLTDGSLRLAHQPKLDLRTGRIDGVECLLRWDRPGHGAVPPDAFMPLVEETGFIEPLTDWVLARALTERARFGDLHVAINLSARSLCTPGLAARLAAIAAAHDAAPAEICLEITETAVMSDPDAALATLHALKAAGFTLAIDDYGTGMSSLAYLRSIPADALKIDRAFVSGMARDAKGAELVRSTIDLAHRLGLRVVAEGVEDQLTLDLLALHGCDEAQGFYIGRPVAADALAATLAAWPHDAPEPRRARTA